MKQTILIQTAYHQMEQWINSTAKEQLGKSWIKFNRGWYIEQHNNKHTLIIPVS